VGWASCPKVGCEYTSGKRRVNYEKENGWADCGKLKELKELKELKVEEATTCSALFNFFNSFNFFN